MPVGASIILTSDSHDTWAAWSPDGTTLAFISSQTDPAGLVLLNVPALAVTKAPQAGLYVASYLVDRSAPRPYRTFPPEEGRTVDGPLWLPDGAALLVRTYACVDYAQISPQDMMSEGFAPCKDFRLDTVRVVDGTTRRGVSVEAKRYTLAPNGTLRMVAEHRPTVVDALDASGGSPREVYRAVEPIVALTYSDSLLVIAQESKVVALDERTGQTRDVADLRTTGSTLQMDGPVLYLTLSAQGSPAASTFHTGTRQSRPLLGPYDYDPVLSPDRRWVAFLSEAAGGIVLQRLR